MTRLTLMLDSLYQKHFDIKICVVIIIIFFLIKTIHNCYASDDILYNKNINTWQNIKWKNITRQKFDYSCGAGALSTLIEYYFKDPASEPLILNDIFQRLLGDEIDDRKEVGLSMMDLKIQAESMGYSAVGVKLTPEILMDLPGPVIVLLKGDRVNHFVVLKGIKRGTVYLADPRRGNIRLSIVDFIPQWENGLTLILGKKGFGLPKDHLLSLPSDISIEENNPEIDIYKKVIRSFNMQEIFPQRKSTFVRQDVH